MHGDTAATALPNEHGTSNAPPCAVGSLARYAARHANFVLVCSEPYNGLGAPQARPRERSGASGAPASDGDGGSGGAKPPGVVRLMQSAQAETAVSPDDTDRELVAWVHPPSWRNPQPRAKYDLVVLGGGTAGLVSAMGAAGLGARVALVERHLLGGDCLNTGCVPSKAILRSARAAGDVRRALSLGVRVNEVPPQTDE
jgi:hypothetical protein